MSQFASPVFTLFGALALASCSPENSNTVPSSLAATNAVCEQADLVLYNTNIYTSNTDQWTAEAVASKDGQIVFVGSNLDAEEYMCVNLPELSIWQVGRSSLDSPIATSTWRASESARRP